MVLHLVCTRHVVAISLVLPLEDHFSTWEVQSASTLNQGLVVSFFLCKRYLNFLSNF